MHIFYPTHKATIKSISRPPLAQASLMHDSGTHTTTLFMSTCAPCEVSANDVVTYNCDASADVHLVGDFNSERAELSKSLD